MKRLSLLFTIYFLLTTSLNGQQTVFYNWLRYNQQKILPTYESSDYWCGNGFIETSNRYLVPYTTTDFKYGEGGFFVLHKNGILDSVLLWDIYNPLIKENNIVDIIKISSNRYCFQRMLTDSFGKNYSDFVFVDSNFKEIKKVEFYRNNGLMIPTGLYLGYDKQSVIAKIYYYLKDANGQVTGFNKSELLRVDTNGTITVLYTQLGRGSNWIFEFALDTSDSTYMICSQNDIATTNNYDHKDTLLYTKMKPSGEIVWQYKWYEYSNKYLFWVHKPNMVINEQGYTFIHYFKDTDNDTSVGVLVRIHRDGKGHKIIKKYYRYELRDKPEFILPFNSQSHYRFGYSVGAIDEIVYDTQQHDSVLNYSIYIAKIDTSGNILWTKRHNANNPNIEYMRDWRVIYCVRRVEDGGYLMIGSGIGTFKNLPPNQKNNYALVIKTDSCGFGSRDTCKIIPKIDSIRYNAVYISLDENKVCGRRWYVEGKIFQSERLEYSFSDTGTYTIGIWGFAGATIDSTSISIRISQLDSCYSDKSAVCAMTGKIESQNCEIVKFSLNKSKSIYCTRYWNVEDRNYYQDTLSYTYPQLGSYTAYLIGRKGLDIDTHAIPVRVDCRSAINDIKNKEIAIYPNPANNYIIVESNNGIGNRKHKTISLYDMLGKEITCPIKISQNGESTLNISNIANGTYTIMYIDGQYMITKQIIIQH